MRAIFSHVVFDPLLVILVPLGVWLLSDVSCSDECRTKVFQYAENMIPLFYAICKIRFFAEDTNPGMLSNVHYNKGIRC